MNKKFIFICISIVVLALIIIFLLSSNESQSIRNSSNGSLFSPEGTIEPASLETANYLTYEKNAVDESLSEGKKVTLYFWANWCPTCRAQEPVNQEVLSSIADPDVVVYKINIFDSDTTEEGEVLAEEYGVTYQHTYIVLDSNAQRVDIKNGFVDADSLTDLLIQERV